MLLPPPTRLCCREGVVVAARLWPSDTRSLLVRLLASIRPVLKFSKKIAYIGIKGGADF